jgi:hypothetical protein
MTDLIANLAIDAALRRPAMKNGLDVDQAPSEKPRSVADAGLKPRLIFSPGLFCALIFEHWPGQAVRAPAYGISLFCGARP